MQHPDHVALIRTGVEGTGPRWLELGCGNGAFTLALADVLRAGEITAVDRDRQVLPEVERRVRRAFPATSLRTAIADFTEALPDGPFDGILAANSLHFVEEVGPVLEAMRHRLTAAGRLVVVEYDADRGNPWVPYPISLARWTTLATAAGFTMPRLIHRVPSRFLGSIYGAVASNG